MGVVLYKQGDFKEAENEMRAALAVRERVLGPENPDTLGNRCNLAAVLYKEGRYAEAEKEDRAVLAIQERVLGPDAPGTLMSQDDLAYLLQETGRKADAEQEFRAVLALRERILGPDNPETIGTMQQLAQVLLTEGKYPGLEQELCLMIAAMDRAKESGATDGTGAASTLRWRQWLAFAQYSQGKYPEAAATQEKALEIARQETGAESQGHVADALFALSRYKLFVRDFAGALAASEAGLALLAKKADALLFLGRVPEAEKIYGERRGQIEDDEPKRSWDAVVIKDLDALEKAGITHPEFARIRELLKPEVK